MSKKKTKTLRVKEPIHRKLRMLAAAEGVTLEGYVEQLIESKIKKAKI